MHHDNLRIPHEVNKFNGNAIKELLLGSDVDLSISMNKPHTGDINEMVSSTMLGEDELWNKVSFLISEYEIGLFGKDDLMAIFKKLLTPKQ